MSDGTIFIVGLGNPGKKYEKTRHNAGFLALDYFVQEASRNGLFDSKGGVGCSWGSKFDGEILIQRLHDRSVVFIKPQTFMNLSGNSVRKALDFYKGSAQDVIVVHDDMDFPLGVVRLKKGGGDGGHNGVRSVGEQLGTKDFIRLRLGIGRPQHNNTDNFQLNSPISADIAPNLVHSWVLGAFAPVESGLLGQALGRAAEALQILLQFGLGSDGFLKAQGRINSLGQ